MLHSFIRKKILGIGDNPTREELWRYMPTRDMLHPALADSLDDDLRIRDDSNFPSYIQEPVAGCFVFPLYSRRYCEFLMNAGDQRGTWGLKSGDPYTAFEIDLFRLSPHLHKYHRDYVFKRIINNVLAGLLDGYTADKLQNSFLIKYTLDTCWKMDMHHDEKSLVSLSVNLNEDYEGGGLNFVRAPQQVVNQSQGYAAMFAGNPMASHRAVPITKGNRYVQVYWLR